MNFTGEHCGWCELPFTKSDDIAVCPECGTPFHRTCYKEHKKCPNQERHTEGFVWKPSGYHVEKIPVEEIICPNCKKKSHRSRFCIHCGHPFPQNGEFRAQNLAPDSPNAEAASFRQMDGSSTENWTLDGFTAENWAAMVSVNKSFYLPALKRMSEGRSKVYFCWYALLFPGFFFLYRGVWGMAAIALIAEIALSVLSIAPTILFSLFVSGSPVVVTGSALALVGGISQGFLLALRTFFALFGVYIWKQNAVSRMNRLRSNCKDEEEFKSKLSSISGPSYRAAMWTLGAGAAILFLFLIFFNLI